MGNATSVLTVSCNTQTGYGNVWVSGVLIRNRDALQKIALITISVRHLHEQALTFRS